MEAEVERGQINYSSAREEGPAEPGFPASPLGSNALAFPTRPAARANIRKF